MAVNKEHRLRQRGMESSFNDVVTAIPLARTVG